MYGDFETTITIVDKNGEESLVEDLHAASIQDKALELSKKYEDGKYTDEFLYFK